MPDPKILTKNEKILEVVKFLLGEGNAVPEKDLVEFVKRVPKKHEGVVSRTMEFADEEFPSVFRQKISFGKYGPRKEANVPKPSEKIYKDLGLSSPWDVERHQTQTYIEQLKLPHKSTTTEGERRVALANQRYETQQMLLEEVFPNEAEKGISWVRRVTPEGEAYLAHPKTGENVFQYIVRKSGTSEKMEPPTKSQQALEYIRQLRQPKLETNEEVLGVVMQGRRAQSWEEFALSDLRKRGLKRVTKSEDALRQMAKEKRDEIFLREWGLYQESPTTYTGPKDLMKRAVAATKTEKAGKIGAQGRKARMEKLAAQPEEVEVPTLSERSKNRAKLQFKKELEERIETTYHPNIRAHMEEWQDLIRHGAHPFDAYKSVLSGAEAKGSGHFARIAEGMLRKHRKAIGLVSVAGAVGVAMPTEESEAGPLSDALKTAGKVSKSMLNSGISREYIKDYMQRVATSFKMPKLLEHVSQREGARVVYRFTDDVEKFLSRSRGKLSKGIHSNQEPIGTYFANKREDIPPLVVPGEFMSGHEGVVEIIADSEKGGVVSAVISPKARVADFSDPKKWQKVLEKYDIDPRLEVVGSKAQEQATRLTEGLKKDYDVVVFPDTVAAQDELKQTVLLSPGQAIAGFGNKYRFLEAAIAATGVGTAGAVLLPEESQAREEERALTVKPQGWSEEEEKLFLPWLQKESQELGFSINPNDPTSPLDFRYAFRNGQSLKELGVTAEDISETFQPEASPEIAKTPDEIETAKLYPGMLPGQKPLDLEGIFKDLTSNPEKKTAQDALFAFNLVKGFTSLLRWAGPFREMMDHTEEKLREAAAEYGVEETGWDKAQEVAGELIPVGWGLKAAHKGAKVLTSWLKWKSDFWLKFLGTAGFGMAYPHLRGEPESETLTETFTDMEFREPFKTITHGLEWGAFEVPAPLIRATKRYMVKHEAVVDKLLKLPLEALRKIKLGKLGGPTAWGVKKYQAENVAELLEPAMSRMAPQTRRLFRDFYIKLGIHEEEVGELTKEIYLGKYSLNRAERSMAYELATRGTLEGLPGVASTRKSVLMGSQPELWTAATGDLAKLPTQRQKLVKQAAREVQLQFLKWGDVATKQGWQNVKNEVRPLLNEVTWRKNLGKYIPRLYGRIKSLDPELAKKLEDYIKTSHVFTPAETKRLEGSGHALRLDLSRFLRRHSLPEDVRAALEQITDIGEVYHRGALSLRHSIETARMFQTIADDPKLSLTQMAYQGAKKMQKGFKPEEWWPVPGVKEGGERFGMLAGRMVNKEVHKEIMGYIDPVIDTSPLLRQAMSWWKFGKVIARPATHVRNMMSNAVLNHLGGMPVYSPHSIQCYTDALEMMRSPEKYASELKQAKELGVFSGAFARHELRRLKGVNLKNATSVVDLLGRVSKVALAKGAHLYEQEEYWAKLAKYLHNTRYRGMQPLQAAEDAIKWTFHYGEVTPAVRAFRSSPLGMPFVTFSYKALPAIAESVMKYPWRFGSLQALLGGMSWLALNELNMSDGEYDDLMSKMPSNIKNGNYLPLPWKDQNGRMQWLDLTYILPWGDYYEAKKAISGGGGMEPGGVGKFIFAHPLWTTAYEVKHNKNYVGQPIYNEWDDGPTVMAKALWHTYKAAVPSLFIGGYDFQKVLWNPVAQQFGLQKESQMDPTALQTLASQVGLKVVPRTKGQVFMGDVSRKKQMEQQAWKQLYKESQTMPSQRAVRRALDSFEDIYGVQD